MNYLWLLAPIVLGVMAYKITTPTFLVDLAATAFKALIPILLKTSPHSKEYWDIQHKIMAGVDQEERRGLEWDLKEVLKKEAEGKLPLH